MAFKVEVAPISGILLIAAEVADFAESYAPEVADDKDFQNSEAFSDNKFALAVEPEALVEELLISLFEVLGVAETKFVSEPDAPFEAAEAKRAVLARMREKVRMFMF